MKAKELRELLYLADDNANIIIRKATKNPFKKLFSIASVRKTEALAYEGDIKSNVTIIVR